LISKFEFPIRGRKSEREFRAESEKDEEGKKAKKEKRKKASNEIRSFFPEGNRRNDDFGQRDRRKCTADHEKKDRKYPMYVIS